MVTGLPGIVAAAAFAAERHRDQRRKGPGAHPYVNHVLAVADLLAGPGGITDADVLIAALLHDTVEDTGTKAEEIAERFGPSVAALVLEVTDDKALEKAERKRLQVLNASKKSPGAKAIKLADKLCNLRDVLSDPPSHWPVARRHAYFDWAEEVVAGLRGTNAALEALIDAELVRRAELG